MLGAVRRRLRPSLLVCLIVLCDAVRRCDFVAELLLPLLLCIAMLRCRCFYRESSVSRSWRGR
jgi:hypothetical protein